MKNHPGSTSVLRSMRRYLIAASVTLSLLLFGLVGWAGLTNLSGAVIGNGKLVVDGRVKKIQHRDGGIVSRIMVRDGMQVNAGDLLIQLDDTLMVANVTIIANQIAQLSARHARLVAERDNLSEIQAPNADTALWGDAEFTAYIVAERALFTARLKMRSNQKSQLLLRIEQIGQESTGLSVRQKAKEEELEWIGQELSRVRNLSQQQLVQFNRLAELERLRAQLRGERGQFIAESAKLAALVTETKLQILQLEQNHLTEVVTELRDIDNKLSELRGQRIAAEDTLKRMSITAPQSGIVHELAVYTIGGVIANGETIMQIVPNDDKFVVEARILPNDIDQIFIGQKATLRFSAFNQRTTPEIFGEVRTVSADLSQNQITGESWYTVRLSMRAEELEHLGNLPLHAGMPVDAFIQTGERTALSYLIKPLEDQISRAFKEE